MEKDELKKRTNHMTNDINKLKSDLELKKILFSFGLFIYFVTKSNNESTDINIDKNVP